MKISDLNALILFLIPLVISVAFLYCMVKAFFYTPAPSGPASIGRAFGFLAAGETVSALSVWYLFYYGPFRLSNDFIIFISCFLLVPVFICISVGSGSLAARSYEHVENMNAKIFISVGFFLHLLISFIVFFNSGYVLFMMLSFIPCSLLGVLYQLKKRSRR